MKLINKILLLLFVVALVPGFFLDLLEVPSKRVKAAGFK